MERMTIDFGIDLGTTNSAIARASGNNDVEIIKNNEGSEYTPSAVFIDKNGALVVGRRAKEKLDVDPENARSEFKLQMGTNAEYLFARSKRRMKCEELSAEVLKSLKAAVKQRMGEDVSAAVITVPAAFELPQCNATNSAAQLAGIGFSPLLQEPVAAALAYGFQTRKDKVFWLVYDLGGGTFDAAVIQVRGGMIQVVNHAGDNHLGGKLIDWAIVENLLIPALLKKEKLTDFRRGNPRWARAIAKLKQAAEEAKINVSADETTNIFIESLCEDDGGNRIDFDHDLSKADVERIARPFILRSINICQKVLAERRLGPANVEKVLLVGGPTLMPYLRAHIADAGEGLGIPLEYGLDPLTVVARGAALFAGTQRNEPVLPSTLPLGQFALEILEYSPVGDDTEPFIGGRVRGSEVDNLTGYTIEFVNRQASTAWRSGKVQLEPDGTFMTTLWAERGRQNIFDLELQDATGRAREITPRSLPYSFGMDAGKPMLIHSVGLALANNEVKVFLEKGTELPARKRFVQSLAHRVRKGEAEEVIRIPVVEGEHKKADRNKLIGHLEICGTQIRRDLPVGAEIEVTIEIDKSRLIRTEAYLTMLNEDYEKTLVLGKEVPDQKELQAELERERKRLDEARQKVYATNDPKAKPILKRIENEHIVEEVESTLDAAGVDQDAADKCQNRLLNMKAIVDELETALEIPMLLAEAEQVIEWTEEIVGKWGQPSDQRKFGLLLAELKSAMEARVPDANDLTRKTDNLDDLRMKILRSRDEWWIDLFAQLEERKEELTNQTLAEQLFTQARRSINNNDIEGVKGACRQLVQLLPPRAVASRGDIISSIMD